MRDAVTTNPFTPQDAERLREALREASEHKRRGPLAGTKSACDEFQRQDLVNWAIVGERCVGMLDLIDALREVAVAAVKETDAENAPWQPEDDSLEAAAEVRREAVDKFYGSPHAEWLKQGR